MDDESLFEAESVSRGPAIPARASGSLTGNKHASAPLAVRMRPRTLDELVGQAQLRAEGAPLRQLIEGDQSMSLLLWGPPGSGKTTIASILSRQTDRRFVEVSAVSAGVKEVRAAIDAARSELVHSGRETVLFIDEVHRFSKAQQDALLPGVENRWVTLVAATTENPFFSVISPLLSRSLLLRLEPLTDADVRAVVDQALVDDRGLGGAVKLTVTRGCSVSTTRATRIPEQVRPPSSSSSLGSRTPGSTSRAAGPDCPTRHERCWVAH